jgi:hypothetical protein
VRTVSWAFAAFLLTVASVSATPFPTLSGVQVPANGILPSAFGEKYLDPLERPFQYAASSSSCTTTACSVTFPAMTHVNTLILRVACTLLLTNDSVVTGATLQGGTANQNTVQPLQAFSYPEIGNGTVMWGINAEAYTFFAKGAVPSVEINTYTMAQNFQCTLSGHST